MRKLGRLLLARVAMTLLTALLCTPIGLWAQNGQIYTGFRATAGTGGTGDQGYGKLVDGKFTSDNHSKWCTEEKSTPPGEDGSYYWVDFQSESPITVRSYILTTADDNASYTSLRSRNPKSWVLKGKLNANDSWTTIATVNQDKVMENENFTDYEFSLSKPGRYQYFRFMISEMVWEFQTIMQLEELRFRAPEDPSNLANATINGVKDHYFFTGNTIPINYTVTASDGTALTLGTHYTAAFTRNGTTVSQVKDAGTYTLTITGKGGYSGTKSVIFKVSNDITLYDDTYENPSVPAYTCEFEKYSRSQFLVPAADLGAGAGAAISSMTFYGGTDYYDSFPLTTESTVDVYLKEVSYNTIENFEAKESATIVYQGPLTFASDRTLTIEFSMPFTYFGGNLLIGIENTTKGSEVPIAYYGQEIDDFSKAISGEDENSPDDISPNQQDFVPKTTFSFVPVSNCPMPTSLAVTNITATKADVSWASDGSAWQLCVRGNESNPINVTTKNYTLTGLTEQTNYTVLVRTVCSPGEYSYWSVKSFTTPSLFQGSGTQSDPYLINNATDWNDLSTQVAAGKTYKGLYLKMTGDIGTASAPVTTMVGASGKPFAGHFIGDGHTLTVAIEGNSGSGVTGAAPFSCIDGATIEDLTVKGTVTGHTYHASGLVGSCGSSDANVIKNCNVETNVVADGYAGGIVGHGGSGRLTIQDCAYGGTISNISNYAGGLLGWCDALTLTIKDCLFKGSFATTGSGKYHPVACKNGGSTVIAKVTNAFRLNTVTATASGSNVIAGAEGVAVSPTQTGEYAYPVQAADGNVYYATLTGGVTVETGIGNEQSTDSDNGLPLNMYLKKSLTQQIYTAAEIDMAGTITSIAFDCTYQEAFSEEGVQVYMMNVDKNSFENDTDMVSVSAGDKVWEGTLAANGAGWVTIDLDKPFEYDGTSNLLVCFYDINNTYVDPDCTFRITSTSTDFPGQYLSLSYYHNTNIPDLNNLGTYDGIKHIRKYRANIRLGIKPSSNTNINAFSPSTLTATDVAVSEATLTWAGGLGVYNVEYRKADSDWTVAAAGTTSTTLTIAGLDKKTHYEARVQSVLGDQVSRWKTIGFTTLEAIPFTEEFAESSIPAGWNSYYGLLEDVLNGTESLLNEETGYLYFGTSNDVFDSHACINISSAYCDTWMVTPTVVMEDRVQLSFDMALTSNIGSLEPPQKTGTDDKFAVLITTDGGNTWTVLRQWDNQGSEYVYNNIVCSETGEYVAIDLSSYAGQKIAIAFYGESTEYNADNNLHIDNVSIDYIPTCPRPTDLSLRSIGMTSAVVSWAEMGSATDWQLCLNNDMDHLISISSEQCSKADGRWSMRLTGLTPGTDYTIKLRSINGNDISSWNTTASFTTLAEYPIPAGLTATLTPGDGTIATLNWTEPGNATDWVLEYGMDADFQGAVSLNVSGTPVADLTDLIPKSTYYARVKAIYNDDNSESPWSNTLVFYPTDSYSHTVYDGDKTGYAPIEGSKCDSYVKSQFIIHAEDLTAIQHATINRLTFYSYYESCDWGTAEFEVYMTEVDYKRLSPDYWADWDKMDLVRNAGRLSVSNHKMVVTLDEPFQYMGGNLLIAFSQTEPGTASYASWWGDDIDNGTILTGYEDRFSCYYGLPKTTIDYTPADVSTMLKPTDLTVAVEGSTAMLSWKENGNATSWIVAYKAEGDTEYREVAEVAENSYTLTGLDLATEYRVKVRAKKGSELSFWSEHTDFRTDFCEPENMCAVSITLTDAFGYGWSSDRLMVVDEKTGVVLGSYALAAGSSETFEINVCIGRTINFVYEASNSTQYSHGYIIKDAQGDLICEHEGCNQYGACDAPTVGVIATYTVSCTPTELMRPNGLTVSENGPHSVKLSWIDHSLIPITSWVVAYKTVVATDFTKVNVTIAEEELPTPAYILTGLAPETQYIVKVRPASNDIVKWSSDVTFTTTEAYTVPVDVAVSDVANHKVTASWTGNNDATAYNLRYRPVQGFYYGFETVEPWAVDTFAPCGTMDGDKCNTRFFTSYSFPNQGYVGACIAFQNMNDNLYANSGNAFGAMFCPFDNNTRADDRFVLPEINVQDGYIFSFWVRSAMHQIGPEQINVEIFEGVSPISSVSFQTSSALWTQYSIDLSPYAGKNIRIGIHYTSMSKLGVMFDDIYVGNPGDATGFTTITGVTAPYQLTGLDENTSYEIQVQAVYGEEGESDWPWVAFTTVTPTIALADNATGNSETISYYDGETAKVTLAGRTLYKDGEWNTICLPFTVALEGSPLDGAIAKTLTDATITGTTVGLSFGNPDSETEPVTTLQAGVPYIIKWEKTEGYDEADATTRDIQNPLFQNVTVVSGSAADRTITKADGHVKFIGYYDAFNIDTPANDDIYYMTVGNTLKHTGKARTLNACRAYFQFSEAAAARQFVLDFGSEKSGITSIDNLRFNVDAMYDLSGRRIDNRKSVNGQLPKGLYIRNGQKVVVK